MHRILLKATVLRATNGIKMLIRDSGVALMPIGRNTGNGILGRDSVDRDGSHPGRTVVVLGGTECSRCISPSAISSPVFG
jgi:hypothetical protein